MAIPCSKCNEQIDNLPDDAEKQEKICNTCHDEMAEDDVSYCHICPALIDTSKGGNACCRCGESMCEDHTDYTLMREIHEATGDEGINPICTRCGGEIRAMSDSDRSRAYKDYCDGYRCSEGA